MRIENRKSKIRFVVVFMAAGLLLMVSTTVCAAAPRISYDRLEQFFMQGQFAAAVSEADALLKAGYGRKEDLYYLKGLSELKLSKFADARASFGWITAKYPRSEKAFDAYLGIGDSYMLAGQLNDAVGIYVGMLDNFRSDKNLPIVHSRLASCYKSLGVRDKSEYYAAMARQAAPLGFEAKPAAAAAPARSAVTKPPAPVSSIQPREQAEADVIMATGASFSVQIGSFKNRRNAENLARRFASAGFESRIEIPVTQGNKFYRVKVGRVSTRAEAEALAARLRASGCNTKICDGETCE